MSLSPREDNISDEIFNLRRNLRDLASISTISASWAGYDQERIADSLADVLMRTLSLDLIHIKFAGNDAKSGTEVARCSQMRDSVENREAIRCSIDTWLSEPFESSSAIPHPFQKGMLSVTYAPFGYPGNTGTIVAGSSRPEFPLEHERLLISVGADQAAMAIRQKRMEEERIFLLEREREAHKEAERASRLREEFLAVLSHELRTPLNSVLGWTQILRRSPWQEELRGQALDAIERGVGAQTRLIEELLDVSRMISGKLRIEVQTVELMPLLQGAIEIERFGAEAKSIRIQSYLNPGIGFIKGDPTRLQQIFHNLLSNAVKFTSKGGTIKVRLGRCNSDAEVSVNDTGQGIAPEFLSNVFDRFSQEDSSRTRSHGGLGLGLAIVKHLVELHGGNTYATSAGEGKGSTFSVHLPIAIIDQDPFGRKGLDSTVVNLGQVCGDVDLSNVRVLIVDDDTDAREMLRHVFQEYGATVELAASVMEALERLNETVHDVIISDIGMPDMDGYQLLRRVRSLDAKIPAIAVTAFAGSEDRLRALQAGYNVHVAKPIEPQELIKAVAALIHAGSTG
jgi:signal transduction histidine kinase/CheY-like chemotaxis protein